MLSKYVNAVKQIQENIKPYNEKIMVPAYFENIILNRDTGRELKYFSDLSPVCSKLKALMLNSITIISPF